MRLSTTQNHIIRLQSVIKDCHSQAKIYTLPSDAHFDNMKNRVWNDDAFDRLPAWAKSYLQGFSKAMFDILFQYELETRVYLDGQYIYGKDVPKGRWADVVPSEHTWFWKDSLRPF